MLMLLFNISKYRVANAFFIIFTENILCNKSDTDIGTLLTDGTGNDTCVSIDTSLSVYYQLEKNFSSSIIKVHFKGKISIFDI